MLEGPFAEQNSREVELKEFVEPALMGQVLHFLYFKNGEHIERLGEIFVTCILLARARGAGVHNKDGWMFVSYLFDAH